ncbi:LysM peptidoglycan-binding domain-containing protein [Wenzhouxiangella sp. XN79A]|uniref:LysM peptidoglycan-binding domain-containing protein n=1 Tax=Wenzhouxiangella sp. XN79A TaxID=2724193 RepID=UPI00144AB8A3|nr:LysM domain-containing protein [Wenzhouxiangella sp. XN79A]NKI35852.1 LysM peptidoglycan-binding domain-containing protein [Wenzhouxiangella sp. XN79A]
MKKLCITMIALLVALPLVAQDVEIREDHPGEYVVQEGDTLWDIAGRFLTRPWQWPAIWQANPQIENPHLIYPGDRLSLIYVDGQPRLVINADGTRRLGPEIRREAVTGPITTVPLGAIEPYLTRPRVLGPDELAALPYVVANQDERYVAAPPDYSYVRNLPDAPLNSEYMLARLTSQFERVDADQGSAIRQNQLRNNRGAVPSDQRPVEVGARGGWNPFSRFGQRGDVVGYGLWEVARVRLAKNGDPATVEIIDAELDVRAGDYLLPLDPYLYDLTFYPRPPEQAIPDGARVIGTFGGEYGVGHYQIVTLDLGRNDGVEPGVTFSAFRPGQSVEDGFNRGLRGRPAPAGDLKRSVDLPEQYVGVMMVFRAFEEVSYALVMDGKRAVSSGDRIAHPDRRL